MRKGTHHSRESKMLISEATKNAMKKRAVRNKILKTAFKKGSSPWNKGVKGIHLSPNTEFKGESGKNHPSWKGGVQISVNDCAYLWKGANKRIRRPKAIYEAEKGKVPKGFVIYHKDGDKHNDNIRNLEAISRAELLLRNKEKSK